MSACACRYDGLISGSFSPPDDALAVWPRRPAVQRAVEDLEGPVDAQAPDSGRRLLFLLEEGVGNEVGHLEQMVGVGASEQVLR